MIRPLHVFLLLVIAACSSRQDAADTASPADSTAPPDTATTARNDSALTSEGWGPLTIGMTRAQVVAAAGPDANPRAVGSADQESCDQFRPRSAPEGLLVMIERDTLTRISLGRNATMATDAGFAVGDSAAAVERHYGARATSTPHKYVEAPARYLTIWTRGRPPASSARGIVYEIGRDARITHIHAGGPSIQYVEGCL